MLDYYLNSQIFVDLGEEFEVHDSNGEQPISFMISNVERVSLALSSFVRSLPACVISAVMR